MVSIRNQLTKECIRKHYKDNFEMADYAIRLARYAIHSGAELNLDRFLDEVIRNPHQFSREEIEDLEKHRLAEEEETSREREHGRDREHGRERENHREKEHYKEKELVKE